MIQFLEGLFYIIFVALIVTIFELLFFLYVIYPKQYDEFYNYVKNNKVLSIPVNIPSNITKYLEIFREREHILINKINNDIIIFICIEIFVIMLLLYIIYTKKIILKKSILYSIITIFILLLFQIQMYYFGIKFKYIGYYGSSEILAIVFKTLELKC